MGCAAGIVKYLVFLFNLVFAIAGLGLIIVGGLAIANIGDFSEALNKTDLSVQSLPILVLVLGSIVFVISFFGCCGALRESTCMLTTYGVLLLTIFILQIALGVFAVIKVKDEDGFEKELHNGMLEIINKYYNNKDSKEFLDMIQEKLECCGSKDPVKEYPPNKLPSSCCKNKPTECKTGNQYKNGCTDEIFNKIRDSINIISYVAFGLCATELIAAIFSLCLASSIRNSMRRRHA